LVSRAAKALLRSELVLEVVDAPDVVEASDVDDEAELNADSISDRLREPSPLVSRLLTRSDDRAEAALSCKEVSADKVSELNRSEPLLLAAGGVPGGGPCVTSVEVADWVESAEPV
jgi:hypothetical protein